MKWQIVYILSLIAIPVVPLTAVELGFVDDRNTTSFTLLILPLLVLNFAARVMADIEAEQISVLWYIMLIGFSSFFIYFGFFK